MATLVANDSDYNLRRIYGSIKIVTHWGIQLDGERMFAYANGYSGKWGLRQGDNVHIMVDSDDLVYDVEQAYVPTEKAMYSTPLRRELPVDEMRLTARIAALDATVKTHTGYNGPEKIETVLRYAEQYEAWLMREQ